MVFTKHGKKWTAKKIFQNKEEDFLHHLMEDVLKTKHDLLAGDQPQCIVTFTVPELPENIASIERPEKEEVVAAHQTRMQTT